MIRVLLIAALAAFVAGCASTGPRADAGAPAASAPPPAATAPSDPETVAAAPAKRKLSCVQE